MRKYRAARARAHAAKMDSKRQSLLLGAVITILACLVLAAWSQQVNAAIRGPATTDAEAMQSDGDAITPRDVLIGRWYGEQQRAGGKMKRWTVETFPDGVFLITFRFYEPDGDFREQIEVGEWAISGPVYFLSTKGWIDGDTLLEADTTSPELYDAYRIIRLEPEVFEYEHFVSGNRYRVHRVSSSFALPE